MTISPESLRAPAPPFRGCEEASNETKAALKSAQKRFLDALQANADEQLINGMALERPTKPL